MPSRADYMSPKFCEDCRSGRLGVSEACEDCGSDRLGVFEACEDGIDEIILELTDYYWNSRNVIGIDGIWMEVPSGLGWLCFLVDWMNHQRVLSKEGSLSQTALRHVGSLVLSKIALAGVRLPKGA
ncbi:hypothetical protein L3X38_036582 [Prunus dulcis]|uniref:Uncharacterized protein n=1 Tax=Prunus dulcis TaxID=3755 RepID=A0AAD4V1I1_PRUDU|nr:hypothetical protein L3X38_036582 [Prunus dulcis]